MPDSRISNWIAGWSAIAAGTCWISWAIANVVSHGAFEREAPTSSGPPAASLLTAGWNLLLIPAAFRLQHLLRRTRPSLVQLWSAAGVLSLSFWAFGGLTRVTPALETTYLLLSAVWLLGIGAALRSGTPTLALFTLCVGAFTALDAAFTFFEPMPFVLYILASPKLPLSALWSIVIGTALLRWPTDDGV